MGNRRQPLKQNRTAICVRIYLLVTGYCDLIGDKISKQKGSRTIVIQLVNFTSVFPEVFDLATANLTFQ